MLFTSLNKFGKPSLFFSASRKPDATFNQLLHQFHQFFIIFNFLLYAFHILSFNEFCVTFTLKCVTEIIIRTMFYWVPGSTTLATRFSTYTAAGIECSWTQISNRINTLLYFLDFLFQSFNIHIWQHSNAVRFCQEKNSFFFRF